MKNLRALVLLLCLLPPLLFAGCVRAGRADFPAFAAALRKADPAAGFSENEAFFADGTYYVYYSLRSPHDTLLALREDAHGKLDRFSLTIAADSADAADDFVRLCGALAAQFCPACDPAALLSAAGVAPDALFRDALTSAVQGRYTAALNASSLGACFSVTRT